MKAFRINDRQVGKRMTRLAIRFVLALSALICAVSVARAAITEQDLRSFEKGKSTSAEVIAKFGTPSKVELNSEGLRAIIYTADPASLEPGAIFAFIGALDGVFMPGAQRTDMKAGNAATAFVFDRRGRLMYFRSAISATSQVTSEDGAGVMPNVNLSLTTKQRQTALPPDDGKAHLGIQLVPVSDLDSEHRQEFAAARFDGLVVANVIPGTPAEQAGVHNRDYLYVLNGMLVSSFDDAAKAMATVKKGDTVIARAKRIDEAAHLAKETVFKLKF